MSKIKDIQADFETSKKAYDLGLKRETTFYWHTETEKLWVRFTDKESDFFRELEDGRAEDGETRAFLIPAYSVEEVPLPTGGITIEGKRSFPVTDLGDNAIKWVFYDKSEREWLEQDTYTIIDATEATARLKSAIWLIENEPEAKQWYTVSGYLTGKGDES